jgi:hypothetical protein
MCIRPPKDLKDVTLFGTYLIFLVKYLKYVIRRITLKTFLSLSLSLSQAGLIANRSLVEVDDKHRWVG